jgi:hypothetical protein
MVHLRVVALVSLLVGLVAAPARASIESDLVKQGMVAYEELDYQKAVDYLHKALTETLTKEEKVLTFKILAFSHVALEKPAEAQKDFEQLLTIDPSFQMDRTVSPRVRVVFEKAQTRIATTGVPTSDGGSGLRPEVPRQVKEGTPMTVRVSYPGGVATKMVLFYRTRGQYRFNAIDVRPSPGGATFQTTIPGMHVQAPAFEYYVNMVDESGAGVASAGSIGRPLAVEVQGKPKPIAKNPAFWGGLVAGVVVVGVVAGVLGATLPSHIGPDTPSTLTIQPH